AVRRVGHRVYLGEEPLGQLDGLALAHLVGLHRHQGVVTAFGLHRNPDLPDGATEPADPRLLLDRREPGAEESRRAREHVVGREVGAVEVFHSWVVGREAWVVVEHGEQSLTTHDPRLTTALRPPGSTRSPDG